MTSAAAGDGTQPEPVAENLGRRRASGIYGIIITAAILDTIGGRASTTVLVISVVGTLVYWVAEQYAEILGEHTTGGQLPSLAYIRGTLAATWPMVSASFAPLLAVVLAALAGASALTAANVGLVVAMAVLTIHGWLAGRAARLQGWKQAPGRHLDCGGTGPDDDLAQGPGPDPPALTLALGLGGL